MSNRRIRVVDIFILSLLIIIGGCIPQSRPLPNQGQTEVLPNEIPQVGGQRLSSATQNDNISDIQRSNRMAEQLVNMGNVKKASVIVNGNTAIIGIDFINKSSNIIIDGVNNYINNINTKKLLPQPSPNINTSSQTGSPDAAKININSTSKPDDNSLMNAENSNSEINMVITKAAKALDNGIDNVLVTTDINTIDSIQRLASKMTNEINYIFNITSSADNKR